MLVCSHFTRPGNQRDSPDEETTDWRAVCGKTACTVRRAGWRKPSRPLAWTARPGSGFTRLFEALAMTLVTHMPVAAVARLVGEHDTRLWRIIIH